MSLLKNFKILVNNKKFWTLVTMGFLYFLPFIQNARQNGKFEQIALDQELSVSTVSCILQDSRGFMWIGTRSGLNRYDGYKCTVFYHDRKDTKSLGSSDILCLFEDNFGILWVGTTGGLCRFDRKTETFKRYRWDPKNPKSLSHNYVKSICEGDPGTLWIGTYGYGLDRFDRGTETFFHYRHEKKNPESIGQDYVTSVYKDKRGILWVGLAGKGLDKFDVKEGKFIHYPYKPLDKKSFKNNVIRRIYEDRSGNIWIGTYGGFNKFDLETGQFTHWIHNPDNPRSISHNSVHSIQEGREGKIWIATFGGGLNRFDPETGCFEHWRHDPMNPESLGSDNLQALYLDRLGNLWAGTYAKGAWKLDLNAKKFAHFKHEPGNSNSLNNNMILSIFQERAGILWIGTMGGGLNKYDPETQTFTHYKHDPKNPNSLSHNTVMSVCAGESGILWIGTEGGGLNKFNPETGIFTHYKWDAKNPKKLSYGVIQTMHMGKSGFLWIATNGGGLNRLDPKTGIFKWWIPKRGDPKTLSSLWLISVLEDKNGVVWVGTRNGGLNRFDPRTETFSCYVYNPNDPRSIRSNTAVLIYESKAGDLWIVASGLNKFEREKGNFLRYTTNDGLPSNVICGILEDELGNFWISTYKGLSKFNPHSKTFRNFDKMDGLQADRFSAGAFYKNSTTGQLFFGGHNGFNAFFPDDIKDNLYVPPVVITDFKILNKSVSINDNTIHPQSLLKQSITETREITLSYKNYDFSFEFSALNYMVPEKNQYAYKMEGLHKEWIRTDSKNRQAHFTTLSPGKYIFRVKGSNNDGVWNQEGTSITVFITPPFWKTWWFRSLSVLFFAMLSYLFIHYLKKYFTLIAFWKKKIRVGEYSIIDKIGSGGMATIYKARDTRDKSKIVALKVIRDDIMMDSVQRKRFINEGTIIGSLNHPHIVNIIQRGEDDQKLYIAMEILEGHTLAEKIRHEKAIPVKDCLEIMGQLTDALIAIHSKGIIHRDLKPENIMLIQKEEKRDFVKLLDFGLAKDQSLTRLTETGIVVGTINYIPPEQLAHSEVSMFSDVYSLGIIFYELVTGEKPFIGETTLDIMNQILEKTPLEPATFSYDFSGELNGLIMSMIHKSPDQRPEALEIKDLIEELLGEKSPDRSQ